MADVLHLAYLPNGSFVLPIIARLQGSAKPEVRALGQKWHGSDLSRLGASLSTKITMLGLLARRLYSKLIPLAAELARQPDLGEMVKKGYAWVPSQRELPYEALLELDSFVFEFRSAYEILGKFLRAFSKDILGKPVGEQDLLKVLEARGIPTAWARELQERRKFLFHEHAPWLSYRIMRVDPLDAEPVFLAHVDADPDDLSEAIPVSTPQSIYSGFDSALKELQAWALREITALEQSSGSSK